MIAQSQWQRAIEAVVTSRYTRPIRREGGTTVTTKAFLRGVDFWLLGAVLALSALSLLVLSEATRTLVPHQPLYYVKHQMIWLALGFFVMVAIMNIPFERWRQWRTAVYVLTLLALAAVIVHGHSALGAQRWIDLGAFRFQPSEFAKLGLIVVLADVLEKRRGELKTLKSMAGAIIMTLIPMLLVIKQPDLGTALVMAGILAALLYEAGAPGGKVAAMFGGVGATVVLLIVLHLKFNLPLPLHSYQLTRLLVFINPGLDPMGAGYNIIQSQIALGTGGLTGIGASQIQPVLTFLPARYTDFVFASLSLELGLMGTLSAIVLYALMISRGLHIAHSTRDPYGTLVIIGATTVLAIHTLMNIGMVLGIMPVVGVPLPFLSYGGSSVITDFAAIGLILSGKLHNVRLSFR